MKITNVIMKYDRIGFAVTLSSVIKLDVFGTIEFRLIHFRPDKNNKEKRDTISMFIILFIDSS